MAKAMFEVDHFGYTADIDQPFRGNMEMCSADI